MSTRLDLILTDARTKLASIPTTRDAAVNFKEHVTNVPFITAPIAGADGFEVTHENARATGGFGVYQEEEEEFRLIVKLGHAPFATDKDRENYVARDRKRVADLLEHHTWPEGTHVVLYENSVTDKSQANWWVTSIFFKVVYFSAVEQA